MNSGPADNFRPLIPMGPWSEASFYCFSSPFTCPKLPVCAGLLSRVLSLCFGAGWVQPTLTLSLGYPPCYPFPVLLASSSAFNPYSSIFWALSTACCRCPWGSAMLVLARNCITALVALGSPRSLPCGYSAVVGLPWKIESCCTIKIFLSNSWGTHNRGVRCQVFSLVVFIVVLNQFVIDKSLAFVPSGKCPSPVWKTSSASLYF